MRQPTGLSDRSACIRCIHRYLVSCRHFSRVTRELSCHSRAFVHTHPSVGVYETIGRQGFLPRWKSNAYGFGNCWTKHQGCCLRQKLKTRRACETACRGKRHMAKLCCTIVTDRRKKGFNQSKRKNAANMNLHVTALNCSREGKYWEK